MNRFLGKNRPRGFRDRRAAGSAWVPRALLAASLLLLAGCRGCTPSSTPSGPGGSDDVGTADQWQEDLFDYAIGNLNRLEEFDTGEMLGRILMRLHRQSSSPQRPPDRKYDALMETWPEPEMLRQIVNRLNQWVRTLEPKGGWKPDPLLETLPEPLGELPPVRDLGNLEFSQYDGFVLREAVWLRDVSDRAAGDQLRGVECAKRLFDWTVRNIQLEPDTAEWIPQVPWETLLFGRGTAMERAWVFLLLARQQKLDAVLLAPAAADRPADEPLRPWAVAVLSQGELYLFDPYLGLPIPAADGLKLDPTGQLDVQPATLAQVVADQALLGQLDVEGARPYSYPVKSSDLERVVVLVEGSPTYLARRTKLVEARMETHQRMVLTTFPTAVADRVAGRLKAAGVAAEARLWAFPLETIRRRLQLSPERIRHRLLAMLPFYAAGTGARAEERSPDVSFDPMDETLAYKPLSKVSQPQQIAAPLLQGRVLYLKGKLTESVECLLKALKADEQLKNEEQQRAAFYRERALEANRQVPANRRLPDEQVAAIAEQAARYETTFPRRAKQDASYWLGLISYQRANYLAAVDYFLTRTLQASPGGPWIHGARYNLARTFEISGEHEKAIEHYRSDTTSPAYHGNLLRARWLRAQQPEPGEQEAAAGKAVP